MESMWTKSQTKLEEYNVPEWAKELKHQPTCRVKIANRPTPIQYWALPGIPDDISVFIKRDDMNGSTLTGNKTRKLEFVLGDAIQKGYKDVITIGNTQSNHVRTTMMAAKEVGLQGHCVCYAKEGSAFQDIIVDGNLYITKMSGCHCYFVIHNRLEFLKNSDNILQQAIEHIKKTTGRSCYKIPLGGTDVVGVYGYMDAYQELLGQGLVDHVTDIVITCGTGGSLSGLAIANYLVHGDKIKVHGYSVALEPQSAYDSINTDLQNLGIDGVTCRDIVTITDCRGVGYAQNTPEELAFIEHISNSTGILLDTSYTGKTALAMVQDLKNKPKKFKGKEILFIHTGGIYKNLTSEKLGEIQKASTLDKSEQIWTEWRPDI